MSTPTEDPQKPKRERKSGIGRVWGALFNGGVFDLRFAIALILFPILNLWFVFLAVHFRNIPQGLSALSGYAGWLWMWAILAKAADRVTEVGPDDGLPRLRMVPAMLLWVGGIMGGLYFVH